MLKENNTLSGIFWLLKLLLSVGKNLRSYMFSTLRKPVEYFLKAVDEVTPQDIAKIAQKLLQSPLTMASYGDGN